MTPSLSISDSHSYLSIAILCHPLHRTKLLALTRISQDASAEMMLQAIDAMLENLFLYLPNELKLVQPDDEKAEDDSVTRRNGNSYDGGSFRNDNDYPNGAMELEYRASDVQRVMNFMEDSIRTATSFMYAYLENNRDMQSAALRNRTFAIVTCLCFSNTN